MSRRRPAGADPAGRRGQGTITTVPTRPPGRPREVDLAAVARTAVDLFTARGYDQVSLDDVAAASGVSRRSLFNHFPTKSDLLWSGFETYTDQLRSHLARPVGEPQALGDVVAAALQAALDGLGDDGLDLARARLRVVAAHPATAAAGLRVVAATRAVLLEHLARHVGDLEARCVAAGLAAAVYEAMLCWAAGDARRPTAEVTTCVRALLGGDVGTRRV